MIRTELARIADAIVTKNKGIPGIKVLSGRQAPTAVTHCCADQEKQAA